MTVVINFSAFDRPEKVGLILSEYVRNNSMSAVYIAAPFDDAELIDKIIAAVDDDVKVFSGKEMETFAKEKYGNCPEMIENFHDAFSLAEQEMCQQSEIFLYSSGSR